MVIQRVEEVWGEWKCSQIAKMCFVLFCFFLLSTKHWRLMQFHGQVWFTLGPIHCLRGRRRLRIFMLSNFQPLCPTTGLVKPVFHFLGSHRIHQCSSVTDIWWIRCRRAKSTLTPPTAHPSFWPRTETPWETLRVAATNCCCAHWGEGLGVRAKLIIQVQFSVSGGHWVVSCCEGKHR